MNKKIVLRNLIVSLTILILLFFLIVSCNESGSNKFGGGEGSISGVLDSTFGGRGYVVHNNAAGGNGNDRGKSIYVDSSGKIYVTGESYNGSNYDMVIWRYK